MRVLLSEGASTSARQAITALGLNGHEIEVCDPNPLCLGRFSRFVSRFHRCPGLGTDPHGYLSFILDQITGGRFDVLLPIHEQGFLFARLQEQILPHVAVALPSFDSYERAHSKSGFSRLLSELDLPQPGTRFVASAEELLRIESFPYVLKAAIGTASRGTWVIDNGGELQAATDELQRSGAFAEPVLVQELAAGHVEHAQAVFCQGDLVGFHGCRQLSHGAGGGDATKLSILRPTVRSHMARVGEHLRWHGALSLDYILHGTVPLYIDCNPRLVEPMSAFLAGLDLTDLLLRVSRGDALSSATGSQQGVRTHSAIQVLLGCAMRDQRRSSLLRECWLLLTNRGAYRASREELTPVRWDWLSAIPLIVAVLWLLVRPAAAYDLPKKGWGSHLLNPESIRKIRALGAHGSPGAET
jgi:predicted ATP-grasp superfamily ATP-dependent carboligase